MAPQPPNGCWMIQFLLINTLPQLNIVEFLYLTEKKEGTSYSMIKYAFKNMPIKATKLKFICRGNNEDSTPPAENLEVTLNITFKR